MPKVVELQTGIIEVSSESPYTSKHAERDILILTPLQSRVINLLSLPEGMTTYISQSRNGIAECPLTILSTNIRLSKDIHVYFLCIYIRNGEMHRN